MTTEELRERARLLIEESERILERARQIEVETRTLVKPDTEVDASRQWTLLANSKIAD